MEIMNVTSSKYERCQEHKKPVDEEDHKKREYIKLKATQLMADIKEFDVCIFKLIIKYEKF